MEICESYGISYKVVIYHNSLPFTPGCPGICGILELRKRIAEKKLQLKQSQEPGSSDTLCRC